MAPVHSLAFVNNDTVMPKKVLSPRLAGNQVVAPTTSLNILDVRLLLYPVEVLVDTVHQEGAKLLAVVLQEICKLWSKLTDGLLDRAGGNGCIIASPNIAQKIGVRKRNSTPTSKRIPFVEVLVIQTISEVLRERVDVIHALQNGIHITCVPKIVQADTPWCRRITPQRLSYVSLAKPVRLALHDLHSLPIGWMGVLDRGRTGVWHFTLVMSVGFADLLAVEINPTAK
mmetsp:Transcript_34674/g.68249  ORF Transcript_34674/g.68249 Transcript_34674/m.68249 type:complete len:228 (-) Transcript_34674:3764-4447(-)